MNAVPEAPPLAELAGDLELLCRLHDRAADAALLEVLRSTPAAEWGVLRLDGTRGAAVCAQLDAALAALPPVLDAATLDALAADYTDLYLNFTRRVAPNESYWRDEDHLERQAAMFAVRRWYAHYGLAVRDWRQRADDHLVHELEFVAALLASPGESALLDAGRFLDRHLLLWSKEFLGGVATRAGTAFYAAVASYTAAWLDTLRALLVSVTGIAPVAHGAVREEARPPLPEAQAYMPGCDPGW